MALFWTPRLLCIGFATFLAMFALDVLAMPIGAGEKALAFIVHLIPPLIILAGLALVWRREWVGALLFPILAALHLVTKWGQLEWAGYAIIEVPLVLLAILFWLNWRYRGELRPETRAESG